MRTETLTPARVARWLPRVWTRLMLAARGTCGALAALAWLTGTAYGAQDAVDPVETTSAPFVPSTVAEPGNPVGAIDGPPPPVPPEVMSRDADGRATVRAVRLGQPLDLDGALDERVYQEVRAFSDFVQIEPVPGELASEQTEVWVFFDGDHIYVSGRCWDSAPESQWVANEMRRDNSNVALNENIAFLLDTFYDRRNGILFDFNAIGGRMDGQVTNERSYNRDWNPVWELRTGRFEHGWTFEATVPFKSLRYRPGRAQVWGLNMRRNVQWKNEVSYLVPMPPARGRGAIFQASFAATLVGLEVPAGSRNLEIKPYAISELTSDRQAAPPVSNDLAGDLGLDVKYGVTQSLVADVTVNTDFAQVEADEQQVNLTRFSLFFPEKREFFLENQGTFAFGGARSFSTRGDTGETPVLFYSRRIGLNQGQAVPIQAGGRLTGRLGKFTLGAMSIQTDDAPAAGAVGTNFSVVRLKRDVLRRSSIGLLVTGRSVSSAGGGSSESYGIDGVFSFYDDVNINTYWAKTSTPGLRADDVSYRTQLDYDNDRYGVQLERLVVGSTFNPEVGFLRRDDMERSFGLLRFSPRPQSIAAVRKVSVEGRIKYITDRAGVLETREGQGTFGLEFENGDEFDVVYTRSYELLTQPFPIASDATIPVGGYGFQDVQASFALGQQRMFSGTVSVQRGSFFSGEKTTVGLSRGRIGLTAHLSVEPSLSFNRLDLPEGRFTTNLATARTTYTVTPLMFVSALFQYNSNSDSLSTNIRLRWEYQPGSELFVVYNEQRDTLAPTRVPELETRAFIVKINRLFQF